MGTNNIAKAVLEEMTNSLLMEGSRDNLLQPYLDIVNKKRRENMTISQFKQLMLHHLTVYGGLNNLSLDSNFYLVGAVRYYFNGDLTLGNKLAILNHSVKDRWNEDVCNKLNQIILIERNAYIDTVGTDMKMPEDFGTLPIDKLIRKYSRKLQGKEDVSKIERPRTKNYTYDICYTYADCTKYEGLTNPGQWCITYSKTNYDNYTYGNNAFFVILLRNDYEKTPREMGKNYPLDNYGLSMIAIQVSKNSDRVVKGTTRWNHGGYDGCPTIPRADDAVSQEMLEKIAGITPEVIHTIREEYQQNSDKYNDRGAETRMINIEKKRKLKYIQMQLNNGQLLSQYVDPEKIQYLYGSKKLNKGIFLFPYNGNGYLIDGGKINFDVRLEIRSYNRNSVVEYTRDKLLANRFVVFASDYHSIYYYDIKRHEFVRHNGNPTFKKSWSSVSRSIGTMANEEDFVKLETGNFECLLDIERGKLVTSPHGVDTFRNVGLFNYYNSRYYKLGIDWSKFYLFDGVDRKFLPLGGHPDGYTSLNETNGYSRYSMSEQLIGDSVLTYNGYTFDLKNNHYIDVSRDERIFGDDYGEDLTERLFLTPNVYIGFIRDRNGESKTIMSYNFYSTYTYKLGKLFMYPQQELIPQFRNYVITHVFDGYGSSDLTRNPTYRFVRLTLKEHGQNLVFDTVKEKVMSFDGSPVVSIVSKYESKKTVITNGYTMLGAVNSDYESFTVVKSQADKVYALSNSALANEEIDENYTNKALDRLTESLIREDRTSRAESRARKYLRKLFDEHPEYLGKIKQLFMMHMHNPQLPQSVRERLQAIYANAQQTGDKEPYVQFCFDEFRDEIPGMRGDGIYFLPGAIRMYFGGEMRQAADFATIGEIASFLGSQPDCGGYDSNFNGLSFYDITEATEEMMEADRQRRREAAEYNDYNLDEAGDYDIVRINSYQQATRYALFNEWCITYGENHWDMYTNDGNYTVYFMLRDGYKNVQRVRGENYPFDDYGLSMISVIVNGRGDLIYSTTRWNEGERHGDIGKMGISPDKALSEMDLGKLVGESFYDAFPPREE